MQPIALDDAHKITLDFGIPAFVSRRGKPVLAADPGKPWRVCGRVDEILLLYVMIRLELVAGQYDGRLRDSLLKAAEAVERELEVS